MRCRRKIFYFLEQVPGTFFRLECGNKERGITQSVHNPRFNIDENILPFSVAFFLSLIREYQKRAQADQ